MTFLKIVLKDARTVLFGAAMQLHGALSSMTRLKTKKYRFS